MSLAFLSHSSADEDLVLSLANKLGRDNCIVDKYNFAIGQPTLREIIRGINESDLFVLFLSESSLNSEWVQKEINQAENLNDDMLFRQILVISIDPLINYHDHRIPEWLRKKYNIQPILEVSILEKKINSKLRDISILKYPHIKKKEEIFIGRNELMASFELDYYSLDQIKPTAIFISGIESIGRRKFIVNALDKVGRLNKFHYNISIALNTRDSIEDFILRVHELNGKIDDQILENVRENDLEWKIDYARHLISKYHAMNEILFIIDQGCIVQPNKQVTNWFNEIIKGDKLKSHLVICVISSFRVYSESLPTGNKTLSFHCSELKPNDRQVLFMKYCELLELKPSKDQNEKILDVLNGMPEQIYYAASLIKDHGINHVTNNIEKIKKYNDTVVYNLIEKIRIEGVLFFDVLVFISLLEFVSYNNIYDIIGNSVEVNEILDKLYLYGVYDRIGQNGEYLKPHHAISDYIKRARYSYSKETKRKIEHFVNTKLLAGEMSSDISELLFTIKNLIKAKIEIPVKYHLPSFILRAVIDHYHAKEYEQVETLSNLILANHRKYDLAIIREVRYYLCMTYARTTNRKFNEQIKEFRGIDYYFLQGFYKRVQRHFSEAEQCFRKALEIFNDSSKSRRELVNVLLAQGHYAEAYDIAEFNYNDNKVNSFHIHAFFMCLIRKKQLSRNDLDKLSELMQSIKMSHDPRSEEIIETMKGEYEYYVNGDLSAAQLQLNKLISDNHSNKYPVRALAEIYSKAGYHEQAEIVYRNNNVQRYTIFDED